MVVTHHMACVCLPVGLPVDSHELAEVVGEGGRCDPHCYESKVVYHGCMLCEEAHAPALVAAQTLPDEQVVVLVVLLREVHALRLGRPTPPPERLVSVQLHTIRDSTVRAFNKYLYSYSHVLVYEYVRSTCRLKRIYKTTSRVDKRCGCGILWKKKKWGIASVTRCQYKLHHTIVM